jgi:chromate reductase
MERLNLLGICGSLRRGSYNRMLLNTVIGMLPDNISITTAEIGDIPLYNADLDTADPPAPVRRFRDQIAAADGLLIASPEYNYSVPGGLKNAIDWASRPANNSVLNRKPVGIMGTAGGRFGSVRAQLNWRQVFLFTESYVMLKPELIVPNAAQVFDANGTLQDESLREFIQTYVEALVIWMTQHKHATSTA